MSNPDAPQQPSTSPSAATAPASSSSHASQAGSSTSSSHTSSSSSGGSSQPPKPKAIYAPPRHAYGPKTGYGLTPARFILPRLLAAATVAAAALYLVPRSPYNPAGREELGSRNLENKT
eukprot:jgi/Chrzof1/3869/Cz13g11230.t1